MLRQNLAHRLFYAFQSLQEVPVEGLLGLLIELFVFLQQCLLRTEVVSCPASARNSFLSSFACRSLRRDRADLFHNFGSRIDLIDDREEAGNLCLVAGHHLQLFNEVFPLGSAQQCQLVHIMAISEIVHFESVLLELERLQQLVYWNVC